jgi:putative membrane protein
MGTLILFLVFGSILAFISKDNLMPISLHVGAYSFANIPLFYVIIGSLVLGFVFCYILSLFRSLSTFFLIRGKDKKIRDNKGDVLELTKRVHQLELENEKLKKSSRFDIQDSNAL